MAKVLLLAFLAAEGAGFLPFWTYTIVDSVSSGRRVAWWVSGLWVLAALCLVVLGREAVRRWKSLRRRFEGGEGLLMVLVLSFGVFWGMGWSFMLLLVP